MAKVLGLGGVFFRAQDPKALASWYQEHLGVTDWWSQQAGPTVFAPFKNDTDYFGSDDQQFMLNFRVADLDALIADLVVAGIPVETREEWDSPEVGRFARIHDPEGNPIELWEPVSPGGT
ncbi:VOC family protein [Pelagibacterium xiamenense]|uniref:VOC family protein n=1 Tax=Pelagibacterium xiamenense TaxID=2901140 RepID=UPI001E31D4AD|nr:VOC family protein [Pelagibacterium xiamenense]MCD7058811.1 VOC family protein [Pelagibacterium xiamenense]